MKRTLLSLVLAVITMSAWAANDNILKFSLDLVGFGDTVVVYRIGHQDVFVGKGGKFEFELKVDTACSALLVQPRLLRNDMDDPQFYSLPLVGGEQVRVWDTTRKRYDVDGTGFYADYHKVDLMIENAGKEQQPLFDYIKANPKQEAAMWILKHISSFDKVREAYQLFAPSVREGRMKFVYDEVMEIEEKIKAQEAMQKKAEQNDGIEAPVFTLNDLEGKSLSLTSLRGKYVVLDFWGSWCVACIGGFPKMKEYYAKYPGKFEILGIDCRDSEAKWKAAVQKYELPWLHVYCPKESTLLDDYGITGFPTKIIIAPDGKIFKTIIGEDPAFYTLLDELFGK